MTDTLNQQDQPISTQPDIHSDHLNTPQRITNTTQQTVWAADYQPFGQATLTTASITNPNPLRFPGQYYDEETNLHYNCFRDYDPTTGRYVQSDPIGLDGGLNTYIYSSGNPMVFIDPFGLIWVTIGHDYHGLSNTKTWLMNRINKRISDGMDPSMPLSDPKELANTKRDVIQEWQPDPSDPPPMCGPDGNTPLVGDKRKITQIYKEGRDPWAIGGISYHWQPIVAGRTMK